MQLLVIDCKGTPYEIGFQHGAAAKEPIARSISFYAGMFVKTSQRSWPQVRETARVFDGKIKALWPDYHTEMQGVADGSGHDLLDIIALNVRTEIAFGLFTDGCTSLSWKTQKRSLLGQNWDWMEEQKPNIIVVSIQQHGKPAIKMVTEAGIIGKIGMNSEGVGVCLNAIRAKGLDTDHMPVHLGLRKVLESRSAEEAIASLESAGMASSAHMLIADPRGGIGLEFSSTTFAKLPMDARGRVYHSNHLLESHPGVEEPLWLEDSCLRVQRIRELSEKFDVKATEPSWTEFGALFEDRMNEPAGICRKQEPPVTTSATLFNIVMDLKAKEALVRLGRPSHSEEELKLDFRES